ncbi:hypothetical protein ABL78_7315 [Leptomonas seymouri]|uniref:Uncharacterized protein n=1 Tax=Leptomonas seymouri TaxID=5684 RepID=A0A0N1I256_LEPSE|nr:hypothetical protein ABL78_7315 [Leptomonas seymouri]|eukprot:KPI83643.1 hypothetical protein ABL78_7315 [Leptomonas seymouri]
MSRPIGSDAAGLPPSAAASTPATASNPPAPAVRRGRGTFKHQLRTEELERQSAAAYGRAEEASTIITAATTTVVLPSSTLGSKMFKPATEEEEIAAQYAHLKKGKDIPLNAVPLVPAAGASSILAPASDTTTTRERLIAAAMAAAAARANAPRTQFGLFENNTNDTARQLLFRNEKRRRYCVIIGDLQNPTRQVTLKLFGHKGEKPFKLQNKLIRLVNLSIGKPRHGIAQDLAAYEEQEADENEGEEEGEEGVQETLEEPEEEVEDVMNATASAETHSLENVNADDSKEASTATAAAAADDEVVRQRALQCETHTAAGFDAEEPMHDVHPSILQGEAEKMRVAADMVVAAAEAVPLPKSDSDNSFEEAEHRGTATATLIDAAAAPSPLLPTDVLQSDPDLTTKHIDPASDQGTAAPSPSPLASTSQVRGRHRHSKKATEVEGEDVDHYLDEDEVVPLTVQQAGMSTSELYENSVANSPVLTARRFSSLQDYFLREFRFLLGLEDVRAQNVSVKINLGAAYCCLARQGSYSTPLKHATFGEFVERMNTESMQLYFIRDCPACVSRAVDMESGSLNFPASSTTIKIIFFSNERQSRSIARAVWDSDEDQFRLLDVENVGVTFNWSVFSLDETFVRRKRELKGEAAATMGGGSFTGSSAVQPPPANPIYRTAAAAAPAPPPQPIYRSPAAGAAARARMGPAPVGIGVGLDMPTHDEEEAGAAARTSAANREGWQAASSLSEDPSAASPQQPAAAVVAEDDEDELARNKTVAYPFEVEFRAFRRWKQQGDNPAAPLAKAILEELSLAEHNYLSHGSSVAYERMDLTNVCKVDFAAEDLNVESIVVEHTSRVKPEGTDLLVDNTTSLFIENFAAARQLKAKVRSYGPVKVAAMQNPSNNNKMRAIYTARRAEGHGGGRDGLRLSPEEMKEVLMPTSKLTFFRSRGSTIHWKLRPNCSLEENIAPMAEALSFLQQVLHTANDIERTSARGGAAPNAL